MMVITLISAYIQRWEWGGSFLGKTRSYHADLWFFFLFSKYDNFLGAVASFLVGDFLDRFYHLYCSLAIKLLAFCEKRRMSQVRLCRPSSNYAKRIC